MAGSAKPPLVGVIAEEDNDVDVVRELANKIVGKGKFSLKDHVAHGCGKLRGKCGKWAADLMDRGCRRLAVVHDLDTDDEKDLRALLGGKIRELTFEDVVIVIPKREIEAWLLSDADALKSVFKMRALPKAPKCPEDIENPKKVLGALVAANSKSMYINTKHNKRIAAAMSVEALERCPSSGPLLEFLERLATAVRSRRSR